MEKRGKGDRTRQKRVRVTTGDRLFTVVVYGLVLLITACCVYPIYYTIIASVSDATALYGGKVTFLPSGFHLDAYREVFSNRQIWRSYALTIFYTVGGTLVNMVLTVPTAYALSRKRMFGRGFLTAVFLVTMYFGGGLIPTYMLFKNLHLVNTPWIMLVCGGLSVYNVVLTRTYFQTSIPDGLYEAARIDGANEFLIFARIMLPLAKPILAVITLYYAVGHWSSWFSAMIYISNTELHPLQLVLRRILIQNESAVMNMGEITSQTLADSLRRKMELTQVMKFALVLISSAPMLVVYPFVQKYFIKGVMVGALKE